MPERTPYLAANWKMNKTVAEAAEFVDALLPRIAATQHDVVLCPPFTALAEVVQRRYGTAVKVAAQNMHEDDSGAFTGEVSAPMLVELDVEAVILGHSERRQLFGETDEALARKVPAALAAELEPILCVGESKEARDGGETETVLERQLQADLGVAHLAVGEADVAALGGELGVRVLIPEAVEDRRLRQRDRVPRAGLGQAPAVEDDQRQRGDQRHQPAASTTAAKSPASSAAPPTRAPSTSGRASSSAALSSLTEPP